MVKGFEWVLSTRLLNCIGGALVDACATVDAGVGIDDCNVIDNDRVLRASIYACAAADTLVCFDGRHVNPLKVNMVSCYITVTVFYKIKLVFPKIFLYVPDDYFLNDRWVFS